MLAKPAAKDFLMTAGVDCVDHSACLCDFAWLELDSWHTLLPVMPCLVIYTNLVVE